MLDVKISSELKEFYDRHGIPEPLRKEAEFMAQEIVIAGRRTAQETLKLGGYIYWTHQKLAHSLNNWSLEDTAEWLSKHGMRFSTKVLREFINFYLTFFNPEELGSNSIDRSLMEYYVYVNQQIESLDTLPEIKNIHTIRALFPALEPPKDKKTARKLIREAIRQGLIDDILRDDPDFAREFRKRVEEVFKDKEVDVEAEEKLQKTEKELELLKKELEHRERTIKDLTERIMMLKEKARKEVEEEIKKSYIEDIKALERELSDLEKERDDLQKQITKIEEERDKYMEMSQELNKQLKEVQKLYETMKEEKEKLEKELQKAKEELEHKTEALEMAIVERDKLEDKYREAKEELAKYKKMEGIIKQISEGFHLLDTAIHYLVVLATYRGEFYDANPKLIRYYVKELDGRMSRLKVIRDYLAEMDRVITVDGGDPHDG